MNARFEKMQTKEIIGGNYWEDGAQIALLQRDIYTGNRGDDD